MFLLNPDFFYKKKKKSNNNTNINTNTYNNTYSSKLYTIDRFNLNRISSFPCD